MNTKIKMAMTIGAAAAMANAICPGAGTVNTSLWFDGSDQQVNTGGDGMYVYEECETTTMGYWYDYDDRKNDHGGSYALYPLDTTGYYGSYIAPEIEEFGYASIGYKLADPVAAGQTAEYPYNFVGFGFNTVGGTQDPLDITAAGGLCATYTTDMPVTLEIAADASGDASCAITLPKAATPSIVSKTIADFKQPTWAKGDIKLADCGEAFKAATAVKFKIDGGASEGEGVLRVFEVGPAGTCKGGKSIATEPKYCYKSDGAGNAALGSDCVGGGTMVGIASSAKVASVKAVLAGRTLSFSGVKGAASFEIVSLQGQVVKSGVVASSVNLSSLNAGVYMVRVAGQSVSMTQKILVK